MLRDHAAVVAARSRLSDTPSPKRRGVWAVGLFAVGMVLGRELSVVPSVWLFCGAAVLAVVAVVVRGWGARVLLSVAMVASGAGWLSFRALELPADSMARELGERPRIVTVEGVVDSAPTVGPALRGRFARFARPDATDPVMRFEFRVAQVVERDEADREVSRTVSGRLWVRLNQPDESIRAGDALRITGNASAIEPASNPGEMDRPLLARQRGIVGQLGVTNNELVVRMASEERLSIASQMGAAWSRVLGWLRARAGAWMNAGEESTVREREPAALLRAMLIGERGDDLREINQSFMRLGIAHIIAVSGMNLVILAWAVLLAVRLLGERPVLEPLLVAASVVVYLMIVPGEAPIIRAGIMVLGFLVAESLGRRYDRLNVLAWTMLLTLLWRPLELWAAGFQLSFAIVAALIVLADPMRVRMFGARPERDTIGPVRWCVEQVKEAVAASVVAWLVATPIAAHHMGMVSPLGVVTTVIVAPLATLLMASGYLTLVVGLIAPTAASVVAPVMFAQSSLIAWVVRVLDSAPGTFFNVPRLPLWFTVGVVVVIVWWMWPRDLARIERAKASAVEWERLRSRMRKLMVARVAATLGLAAWLAWYLGTYSLPRDVAMRIDVFDVGDGSCWLIRSGKEAVLFDCGSLYPAIGEQTLPRGIREVGGWRVPRAIVSHPDLDHFDAIPDVAERVGLREVTVNRRFAGALGRHAESDSSLTTGAQRHRGETAGTDETKGDRIGLLSRELKAQGIVVTTLAAGDAFAVGDAAVRVLSPQADEQFRLSNDSSLVLMITVPTESGERRVLLCGDIQDRAIELLEESGALTRPDVMEAPHHGSARPAAIDFVERLDPPVVVQSTGPRRANDDRWEDVREGRTWWCTAVDGAVTVEIGKSGEITTRSVRRSESQPDLP
ncbi:MAG TPA: ComEC/Rec2 family competence protein [Phycisphaerales bacterium]|nr:ComEC/Rec2 family competence protein [Phycisphaerales bacterium]